jgi:hypothetical protein
MNALNGASAGALLALAAGAAVSGAVWCAFTDSGVVDRGTVGAPHAVGGQAAVAAPARAILTEAECARLRKLGAGICAELRADDFSLVEKALPASNIEGPQWACLAIEKLCFTQGYTGTNPELAPAARLAQLCLNQAYVDRILPRLLDAGTMNNPHLAEFASRAIGSLASHTTLLAADQVDRSCAKALASLGADDFEERRRGVNLLRSLMSRLDVDKNARKKQAIDQLLEIAEDWQRSYHGKWDEWQRELSVRGSAKQRFQNQALQALSSTCRFVSDKAQAMRAYQFLASGLANQTLDLQAVASIAALASRLPAAERRNAVQLVIRGVSDKRFWHNVGSGMFILKNYAADALSELAPFLDKDEVEQALKAIDSQPWNRGESQVFEAAVIALQDRMAKLGS